ncbi:outer membrane efflux protein [Gemmatimonadetes bacterium T265]|nr:outer membrane efflux protein [Gemmatimonadetes bacterium T265]
MSRLLRSAAPGVALVLAGACAVGPSTRVNTAVAPVVGPTAAATPAGTRALLDSLAVVRADEHAGAGASGVGTSGAGGSGVPGAPATGDATRPLWAPARLATDTARELRWLDVLRDPTLVALVGDAVANNRDLRVAQARIREYRAALGVARSSFFPQVTATAARSTNRTVFGPLGFRYNATQVVGDASLELDVWGRIRRNTEAARLDLGAQQEDLRQTTLTLVGDVATAYLQIRELDENLAVADQTVASRRATLDIARRRFQQGVTSELDVRTFEAELAAPATQVATLALQRTQQENQLALLLGRGPTPIPRGRPLAEVVAAVTVPDSVPGAIIADRPDVRAAARALQASIARVGAAVANRLPTVTLSGDYGTQQPGYRNLFRQSGELYTAQAGLSIPLFTGGRLAAEEREARARADEARGQYEQTVYTAQREINDALAGVRLGRDQLVAQATQAQALQRAFAIAQARYRSGVSTYLEVLDAQRQLFAAQLALVQDERQYLVATVDLYRALGGGRDVVPR